MELLSDHESVVTERRDLVYDDGTIDCHECGANREDVSQHWSMGSCEYPKYTEKQYDILTGIVMGDATVQNGGGRTPRVELYGTNERYLEYVREQFPLTFNDVSLKCTGEEQFDRLKDTDFDPNGSPGPYHDQFRLPSKSNDNNSNLLSWYSTGEKVFPPDLSLNPIILRHYYACDGGMDKNRSSSYIQANNENDRQDKIVEMFERVGLDVSFSSNRIRFKKSDTPGFLDRIGPAPPGMEYKWEYKDVERYETLQEYAYR
jgi:hypothetical protein